jgi:serine/threonine protein kinase
MFIQYHMRTQDFIRGLLHGDPLKRPTAEAALAHPWLAAAS